MEYDDLDREKVVGDEESVSAEDMFYANSEKNNYEFNQNALKGFRRLFSEDYEPSTKKKEETENLELADLLERKEPSEEIKVPGSVGTELRQIYKLTKDEARATGEYTDEKSYPVEIERNVAIMDREEQLDQQEPSGDWEGINRAFENI